MRALIVIDGIFNLLNQSNIAQLSVQQFGCDQCDFH